jgi:hypothetical protein
MEAHNNYHCLLLPIRQTVSRWKARQYNSLLSLAVVRGINQNPLDSSAQREQFAGHASEFKSPYQSERCCALLADPNELLTARLESSLGEREVNTATTLI